MKPKLRFQGFHDDWEEKKLGEVAEFSNGVNTDKENYGHGIKMISVLDILNNPTITHNVILNSVNIDTNVLKKHNVQKNDLLFVRSSEILEEVGYANVYDDKEIVTYSGFSICGKIKTNDSGRFIKDSLNIKNRSQIQRKVGGSTRFNISQSILNDIKLFIPSLPEQEKIGAFLSQLDDRIEKQEQKIALLKERKKGWMQQLFSQTIRFKDENGQDYPAWEEKKLGESLSFKAGKKIISAENGKFVVINMGSLSSEGNILSKLYSDEDSTLLKKGDLFMPKDDIGGGNIIGKLGYIDKDNYYVLSDHVYKVSCSECSLFYKYLFLSENIRKEIKKIVTGSAQLGISNKNIEKIKSFVPSLPEQEKIAEFLSKQDEMIEKEEEKLSLLKEQKKGFLQQMFV